MTLAEITAERDAARERCRNLELQLDAAIVDIKTGQRAAADRDELKTLNLNLARRLNEVLARVTQLEAMRSFDLALSPGMDSHLRGLPLEGEVIHFTLETLPVKITNASLKGTAGAADHNGTARQNF